MVRTITITMVSVGVLMTGASAGASVPAVPTGASEQAAVSARLRACPSFSLPIVKGKPEEGRYRFFDIVSIRKYSCRVVRAQALWVMGKGNSRNQYAPIYRRYGDDLYREATYPGSDQVRWRFQRSWSQKGPAVVRFTRATVGVPRD